VAGVTGWVRHLGDGSVASGLGLAGGGIPAWRIRSGRPARLLTVTAWVMQSSKRALLVSPDARVGIFQYHAQFVQKALEFLAR
jgi:hypothetical protein